MWLFRKKTPLDHISQIIRLAKKAKSEIEIAERTGKADKTRALLKIVRKFDIKELHKIEEETGSKVLVQKCIHIHDLINETIKDLDDFTDFEKAKQIIGEIIMLEDDIQREILERRHNLDKYELGSLIGSGGNSHAYEIKGHPELIIITRGSTGFGSGSKDELRYVNQLYLTHQKVPSDVHLARIVEVDMKNGLVATVMQRARGHPLHDRKSESYRMWSDRLEELANAPQSHYDRLIHDMKVLHHSGLQVDPSKPDNMFYDHNFGFTFIDLDLGNYVGSLEVPLIYTYNLFSRFREQISKRDANNILKIMGKLRKAGDMRHEYMNAQINGVVNQVLYKK